MQEDHCKHWAGIRPLLSGGDGKCQAGVSYYDVSAEKDRDKVTINTLPCIAGRCPQAMCAQRVFPTQEEVKQWEVERERLFEESFREVAQSRQAIVEHLGGPWKRGMPSAGGVIDCPVCGGVKTLRYSRAGYNGHIHARCKTEDCVSWME